MPEVESTRSKIMDLEALRAVRQQLRRDGRVVVFTNGCFDLLHVGHISLLEQAKQLGEVLIVAVNSDISARALKGSDRPIVHQEERAEVLAALEAVDYVTVFDEPTPREVIAQLLPDVLVKGGDWGPDEIVGREDVEAAGGKVVRIPYVEGHSTTELMDRIRALASAYAPDSTEPSVPE